MSPNTLRQAALLQGVREVAELGPLRLPPPGKLWLLKAMQAVFSEVEMLPLRLVSTT